MGNQKFYTEEFEQAWKLYNSPPNGSKSKAYEKYKSAKDLPRHELFLKCIVAYNEWLAQQSRPNHPYPKLHMATFVNQSRFEGFLDRAEELLKSDLSVRESTNASLAASARTWPDDILSRIKIPQSVKDTWILPATFHAGPPPKIICPSAFHASWLSSKWAPQIEEVLGPAVIISAVGK